MVLSWSGLKIMPDELIAVVYTPSQKGTTQPALIAAARRYGRVAYIISSPEELMREIASGHPVIVLQNLGLAWYPVWHYAVVIGYDLNAGSVLLHSGEKPAQRVSLKSFNHTWARSGFWGMMTLPLNRIPASATENTYVEAVSGLERAQQWEAAIEGYLTALDRWPASLAAGIGLGNVYYASGDLSSAEQVFRNTIQHSPESGAAFNNLAQVLWEQGKLSEAKKSALTAVRLGGPMIHVYQKTLEDIQADMDRH
jgi:tetratricopeptide (TPR) repeat protein